MAQAAADIVDVTMAPSGRSVDSVRATTSVDAVGTGPEAVRDFDQAFNEMNLADHAYRANLQTARASDAQFQQMLNMTLPEGYSRLVADSKV